MKYYIFVSILILVYGCRSVRQDYASSSVVSDISDKESYNSNYDALLSVNSQLEREIAVLTEEVSRLSSEIDTHDIEYDTDKPVDPVTKTPPKKRERFQTNKHNSDKVVNILEADKSNSNIDYSYYVNRVNELERELNTKTKEYEDYKSSVKSRMALDVWWFWASAGILVYIFVRLFFDKYVKLFRFSRK